MKVFGISFGRQQEVRQEQPPAPSPLTYDQGVAAAMAQYNMGATQQLAERTAAAEFGVGLLARCLMVAETDPDVPLLTPTYLASVMRDLLLRGNHVAFIGIRRGEVQLHRCSGYTITGGPSEDTWRYTGQVFGPSRMVTRNRVPSAGVIHLRINTEPGLPWQGVSPLIKAGFTGDILGRIERSLAQEMNALIGHLLLHPTVTELGTPEERERFKQVLESVQGRHWMVTDGATQGWGQATGASSSWGQVRIGPNPDPNEVSLRSQVSQDILSVLGIPAGLFSPREGAVSRESYRQLLTATIGPYARLMEREFSEKLETVVRFTFHRLAAADVASRARAYQSLTTGPAALDPAEARVLAGLDV